VIDVYYKFRKSVKPPLPAIYDLPFTIHRATCTTNFIKVSNPSSGDLRFTIYDSPGDLYYKFKKSVKPLFRRFTIYDLRFTIYDSHPRNVQ